MRAADRARRLPSDTVVRTALLAAILSTVIHYTDNYINLDDYPSPHWITHAVIPTAWVILTAIGIGGYALFKKGSYAWAGICLVVYSYTGLSSLAHYSYGPLSEFSPRMHAGIWLDGATGAAVFVVALWVLVGDFRRRRGASS